MNQALYRQSLKFGAVSAVIFMLLFGTGWAVVAGWFPPPSPTLSAEEIARQYGENFMRIRLGLVLMMTGTLFFVPFTGALCTLIAKIEGRFGVWSVCALCGGFATTIFIFYPTQWWYAAVYRPERNPDLIYLISDAAWMQFVGAVMPALPLWIALAAVSFAEAGENRIFARWYAYFCAWMTVTFLPSQLLFFVKTGPFAWDGFLALYFPAIMFFAWFMPTIRYIWKEAERVG